MQNSLIIRALLEILPMLPVSSDVAHSAVISSPFSYPPFWTHRLVHASHHCKENLIDRRAVQVGVIAMTFNAVKHFETNPV